MDSSVTIDKVKTKNCGLKRGLNGESPTPEDPGSDPSAHRMAHNCVTPVLGELTDTLFWPLEAPGKPGVHRSQHPYI